MPKGETYYGQLRAWSNIFTLTLVTTLFVADILLSIAQKYAAAFIKDRQVNATLYTALKQPVEPRKMLEKIKQKARQLKSEALVLVIAYKDKRTPLAAKMLIALTVGYLLSPIDLIPDFIPVLGLLDDLIIVPLLISISLKLIPSQILSDAKETAANNSGRLKKTNWFFAMVIICAWAFLVYFIYAHFKYL